MKTIRLSGLGLFIIAFGLLLASLGINNYRLTSDTLHQTITNPAHFEAIAPQVSHMLNKTYSSKFTFLHQLNQEIDALNETYRANQEWDKVIYTDYSFDLIKNSSTGTLVDHTSWFFIMTFVLGVIGALLYILPGIQEGPPGIKHNGIYHHVLTSRGWLGILIGTFLIGFYIVLYWFPAYIVNWVILVDPLSKAISGNPASQWFLYGFLYTLSILVMGIRMFIKYRHSKYQIVRTASVMFFQTAFAFLIPEILVRLRYPYMDLKNIWPLDYSFFFDYRINEFISAGTIGIWMMGWGIALIIIGVPVFVYFFGKRWYCSWVCGCGGLAETLGDPFRQLSDKSLKAWKAERIIVHGVLVFAIVMTGGVLYSYFTNSGTILGINTYNIRAAYGFLIGSIFAGVVGTGFYPFMGNRVWCRFGCPLAAYLGLVQRFKSRFRITTNGGQCISCGNCSTYCEMGIDVRWYAQRGQNIIRSSCVGCGVCSSVCPRGVLNLEVKDEEGRFGKPILIGNDSIKVEN
ncbi:4Fe-4S binding protein [Xanthovirga aplysinae]|uniref:4Fe-4S binding protein n=1 Tax=Xanthovirga aplysinae TaxID=2529853 RepID=UPI0012BC2347|nr:4Fe-4S binding protein [Xanthovirga aplysinae]MTI32053.1 4Fe-4S binding protein [Xanthovirga aplysinae]